MDIILVGNKKTGKTSIQKVVFQKMAPNETWFIEPTIRIETVVTSNNPYLQFNIRDFPGSLDIAKLSPQEEKYFKSCAALIYVIDAQDEPFEDHVTNMIQFFQTAHSMNPNISFEVLIHKIDGGNFTSEESRNTIQHHISNMKREEFREKELPEPTFYPTSIYDHTIYEALSKIFQKVTQQVPFLTALLDNLMNSCRFDKVYIFDVISKLFIASDSTPVDLLSYELCSDMIDVFVDISYIYGREDESHNYSISFDDKSNSMIRLENGLTLYLR